MVIKEKAYVQLRVEAFNVANTVAFLYFPETIGSASFGALRTTKALAMAEYPRVIQFQLKVHF